MKAASLFSVSALLVKHVPAPISYFLGQLQHFLNPGTYHSTPNGAALPTFLFPSLMTGAKGRSQKSNTTPAKPFTPPRLICQRAQKWGWDATAFRLES